MYWSGTDYDRMAKHVIDSYVDYNIRIFPVDEKEICRKLGLKLIPYSEYPEEQEALLRKRSMDAFFAPATRTTPPTVFYNDKVESRGRLRYNIFHEVKHFLTGDKDDGEYNDNMADYFARYFMCPIPYLIEYGIDNELTLISDHLISQEAARNTIKNVRNRKAVYADKIFDYEKPLVDLFAIRF